MARGTGNCQSSRASARGGHDGDRLATWYRLQSRGEPLSEAAAWSEPLHPPDEDGFDDLDEYEYLYGVRSGYSCAGDPHHLVAYLATTDLRPEFGEIVRFRGRQDGYGIDGEPLVLPEEELGRWNWDEFQERLAIEPPPPHQLVPIQHDYDPEGSVALARGPVGTWCSICRAFVASDAPEADHEA
jgi:hypothetical protein